MIEDYGPPKEIVKYPPLERMNRGAIPPLLQ
jgi:hypothetical protein